MVLRFALVVAGLVWLTSAAQCKAPRPTHLNQLRLYVPIPQLEDRFGKDVEPLAEVTHVKDVGEASRRDPGP